MNSNVLVAQISQRLKELRVVRGWSLDVTAKKTGVSKAMLGQIERGESSPTIGILWKIASGFETSFSSFFSEQAEKKESFVTFPNDPAMQITTLFPYSSDTRMEVFKITLCDNHEQHSTPHQLGVIEHVVVLDGVLEVCFDAIWHTLSVGEKTRFYADQPHAYRVVGEKAVFHNIIIYPQDSSSTD
ncbi:helix-turn-helix domain-containing protein [Halodesulfovibrio aestuarii]|uniref:Helix-turn-helix domain-containing protein n=1 Tax=Halodesulfovibrio aestuarii TaxID=126333 RepID=A0ABV4JYJ6_9BACT